MSVAILKMDILADSLVNGDAGHFCPFSVFNSGKNYRGCNIPAIADVSNNASCGNGMDE